MNIKESFLYDEVFEAYAFLPDVCVDVDSIRVIMINEVVPFDPKNDFYGDAKTSSYSASACALFAQADIHSECAHDLLEKGIYITNAVKTPKKNSMIPKRMIEQSLPILEKELALFPKVEIIMAMGDVAIKAVNMLTRKDNGKAVIPSGSTYRLRGQHFYAKDIRYMPSYIMTGKNLEIEKSKAGMIVEDIKEMLKQLTLAQ